MQVETCFRARDADLKTKTKPVTQTLKPDASYNRDLKPLDPYKNEPLLNIFTVHRKTDLGLFLIKLQV